MLPRYYSYHVSDTYDLLEGMIAYDLNEAGVVWAWTTLLVTIERVPSCRIVKRSCQSLCDNLFGFDFICDVTLQPVNICNSEVVETGTYFIIYSSFQISGPREVARSTSDQSYKNDTA
jgi:hypothetical protein